MQDDALNTASVKLNWLFYTTVSSSRYIYLLSVSFLSNYDMTTVTPSHHKCYFLLESAFPRWEI